MAIRDHAFSTAGDYERSFVLDGKRYHHIIDPKTGYPATASRGVTIFAPTAFLADALDDAVFILGPERGMALVDSYPDCSTMIVDAHNKVWVSKSLRGQAAADRTNRRRDPDMPRTPIDLKRPPARPPAVCRARRPRADVAIVGGGIMGSAIALRLAQRGLRVTVIERGIPGAEASSAAAGILGPADGGRGAGPAARARAAQPRALSRAGRRAARRHRHRRRLQPSRACSRWR